MPPGHAAAAPALAARPLLPSLCTVTVGTHPFPSPSPRATDLLYDLGEDEELPWRREGEVWDDDGDGGGGGEAAEAAAAGSGGGGHEVLALHEVVQDIERRERWVQRRPGLPGLAVVPKGGLLRVRVLRARQTCGAASARSLPAAPHPHDPPRASRRGRSVEQECQELLAGLSSAHQRVVAEGFREFSDLLT